MFVKFKEWIWEGGNMALTWLVVLSVLFAVCVYFDCGKSDKSNNNFATGLAVGLAMGR